MVGNDFGGMATKTSNIALTEGLDAFAGSDMATGGFGNFSECQLNLLRRVSDTE